MAASVQKQNTEHALTEVDTESLTGHIANQYAFDALLPAVETYQAFIDDSHDKLRAEFELRKQRSNAEPPKTALNA